MRTKRKTLIEERYYGIKRRQMSFISMVQERAAKLQTSLAPYFSNDLMFKIFLVLPIKSLLRFTCVCKAWNKLIHCEEFVEAYNSQAETTPILLRKHSQGRLNTFHVETQLDQLENFSLFPSSSSSGSRSRFIHFLEIEDEKGKIIDPNMSCSGTVVASCNGLILINSMYEACWKTSRESRNYLDMPLIDGQGKPGRLIVMNPVTRKFIGFPLGTLPYGSLAIHDYRHKESYGLMFSHSNGGYKVVHLFKDKSQYIFCEILSLHTGSWKAVNGPPNGLLMNLSHVPIAAIGALHWLPDLFGSNYIVSMGADNERFSVTDLPKIHGKHDRLVEMGGFLSFVTSLDKDHIDVWILKGLEGAEWVKQHSIHLDAVLGYVDMDDEDFSVRAVAAFALNAKEMIFRRKERLFSYDFELEEIREIEMEEGKLNAYDSIMPHSNNLATWEPLEPMS